MQFAPKTTIEADARRATREEWDQIRSNVAPERLAMFDAGDVPAYVGGVRVLPPSALRTFDVTPNGRITQQRSAPTTTTRPKPEPKRGVSDDVLDAVRGFESGPTNEDAVLAEITRAFGAEHAAPAAAPTPTRATSDDVLAEVSKLGADAVSDAALDEVAALTTEVQ